jgi:riboflavin biosynthesis pyrimidine reductase
VLVVVTGSGQLNPSQPALRDCLILTTPRGGDRLRGTLPEGARVAVVGAQPIAGRSLVDVLHTQGLRTILVEGGPTLLGPLLAEGLIDELFLTSSPLLFGRHPGDLRKSLVEGVDLGGRAMELASLRRHESYLYLRYRLLSA